MSKTKKLTISVLCVFMVLLSSLGLLEFTTQKAFAETEPMTVEDYTNSDFLHKSDGSDSLKTIVEFADEVKAAGVGKYFPELSEVIPRQYLESNEDNATFKYFGKEYGFYVEKTGLRFSVLLIDFTYEFDDENHTSKEYKIKIAPILHKTFYRQPTETGFTYSTMIGGDLFYVANPRFLTVLQNENMLNYGDTGYSKDKDDGVIISQSRTNYENVVSPTSSDIGDVIGSFMGEKLFDYVLGALDPTGLSGAIKDVINLGVDISNADKGAYVTANNEQNILTEYSRSEQAANVDLLSYSRVAGFMPKSDIILSDDSASSAEFIVMLDDTNNRCRLTQICDFDIYKKGSGLFDSFEFVVSSDEDKSLSFYNQKVLFDDVTEVNDSFMSYYILPQGDEKFIYKPQYSGTYTIESGNSDVKIEVNGVQSEKSSYTMYFVGDRNYYITFTSEKKCQGIGTINIKKYDGELIDLSSGNNFILKYIPAETTLYEFCYADATITIFDKNMNICENADSNILSNLVAGETYYVLLKNNKNSLLSDVLTIRKPDIIQLNRNEQLSLKVYGEEVQFYQLDFDLSGRYDFSFYGNQISDLDVKIISTEPTLISVEKVVGNDSLLLRTYNSLLAGIYYIRLSANSDKDMQFVYSYYDTDYYWKIDGEIYLNGVGITRGDNHTIELYNSLNEKMNNRALAIEMTYSDVTSLMEDNGIYTFKIDDDAKMFNDQLTYYCTFYVLEDKNMDVSFPVVFQEKNLGLESRSYTVVSSNSDTKRAYIYFNNYIYKAGESIKMVVRYKFDNYAEITSTIDYKIYVYIDELTGFSPSYYNVLFTIDRLIVKDSASSVVKGIVYNDALSLYSNKINTFSADSVTVGLHFKSGTGTATDPFIIDNPAQFSQIGCTANSKNEVTSYFLLNNVHFSGTERLSMFDCVFQGVLDGNNGEIWCDVYASLTSGNRAMFEEIGSKGLVKNLKFHYNLVGTIDENKVSAPIAVTNKGTIKNCEITALISKENYSNGGIVVFNEGLISDCSVSGAVYGGKYLGGIAAVNSGTISNCTCNARLYYCFRVTDNDYMGGIAGYCQGGSITNCTFNGLIHVNVKDWDSRSYQPYIGGIAGFKESSAKITNCTFAGVFEIDNLNPDVSWWSWFVTHHFNQQENINFIYNS